MITGLSIKNVRGFKEFLVDLRLFPNKVNIIVAPNGFGKTSVTQALKGCQGSKLVIPEKDKHSDLISESSTVSLCIGNNWLSATEDENQISKSIDVHVIRSLIEPKAKLPRINGIPVARPYLEIPSVDFGPAMQRPNFLYDLQRFRTELSPNSKVVPNLTKKLEDIESRVIVSDVLSLIAKIPSSQKSSGFISNILDFIRNVDGTRIEIEKLVEKEYRARMAKYSGLSAIHDHFSKKIPNLTWLENILIIHQLSVLTKENKSDLVKWLNFAAYSLRLSRMKSFLRDVNSAWVGAEIKEAGGRLFVSFPDANSLSNGQRDLLYFTSCLLRVREKISSKDAILVIDEVFDYLDDANIAVAQYYLSHLIDSFKSEERKIYILLMTHLDPVYFRGYALRHQVTSYLGTPNYKITETVKTIIRNREDSAWSNELSEFFLHYNPNEKDIGSIFNEKYGLAKKMGLNVNFYSFVENEWNKALNGADPYDPFALCIFVRIQIERKVYDALPSESAKLTFLSTHGTSNKLTYAASVGVNVPEIFLLLGIIYNDALHKKGALEEGSSLALKLRNTALMGMLRTAVAAEVSAA